MVLNYIWIGFFLVAFVVALVKLIFLHDLTVFTAIVDSTFDMAKTSVDISIYLIGVMTLWLGIMRIGEKGGAVNGLSRIVVPFFNKLFPELPKNHPAFGSMMMNFSANMLGLDNAATPLGLKAMNQLQETNTTKDTASNAQIMFLVLNTSGLTIIPISVIAYRASAGAVMPTDVFIPILMATYFATLGGLIVVAIRQKINLFNKVVLAYLGSITAVIIGLIVYFQSLEQEKLNALSGLMANLIIFTIIVAFLIAGIRKKINLYNAFIDGAKDGFKIAVKIIPYLVAMLVAIGAFRASGAMNYLVDGIAVGLAALGINTDFVGALPTAFMKPLSGSGARGMMLETMEHYGADHFISRLACTFQGSTETTFYTVAVYYGAVRIKNTRYTITAGLIADLIGILAAIFIAYIFFYE